MSNTAPPTTLARILELAWAFAPPLVIEAAVRHRVFDALAKQALTLGELAGATGASGRGLRAIANVLVGLGLLARDDTWRYALTPESGAFLVSDQPGFIGGRMRWRGFRRRPTMNESTDGTRTHSPRHADEGRHPRLSRTHQGQSWMAGLRPP